MKKLGLITKILTVVMIVSVLFTLASCGGSLKLKSFIVDNSSIKTTYYIGDEVDFSGIKAYAKYSDETLNKTYTYDELTLVYDENLTATEGEKELVVSFKDPNFNNAEQKTTVIIKVIDPNAATPTGSKVVSYEKPASIISFEANNKDGTLAPDAAGFSGEFLKGGAVYVVGDDNEFRFVPKMVVRTPDYQVLRAFHANIEMSILEGEEYVPLTKQVGTDNTVTFLNGDTKIADVDAFNNFYDFSEAAVGKQVKISVLPSADYYEFDEGTHAVVLEVTVVDAYNVYEAWQLAVIDNDTTRDDWNDIKNENGISDLTVAGIVLHNDIKLTSNDVPESFFYTVNNDVVYTKYGSDETKTIYKGAKFLKDWTEVYIRMGAGDFTVNGNFFNLNASEFPVVPSPAVFGEELKDVHYGDDFSNSTLIRFETDASAAETPADVAVVTIDNLSIIGNAGRDSYLDQKGHLASAGGLIFLKSTHYSDVTINNVIGNSFFIAYFPDSAGDLTANHVKCYDSYQNAAMVWGNSTLTFNDSYISGCGGPVIIAQSVVDDGKHPTLITNNTKIETNLTGEEIWFAAVNASAIVTDIKALGSGIHGGGLGNFVNSSGNMNILGLLMTNGSDAGEILLEPNAQGAMNLDGHGIERWNDAEHLWSTIVNHPAYTANAPFLSVVDGEGNTHVLFWNGTNLCDLYGNTFAPNPTDATNPHNAIYMAFVSAEYITLSMGGISVVFEFYHY